MNNLFQEKHQEFMNNIQHNMYTFEVTKGCGYSTFVTVYKTECLMDLYANIVQHFEYLSIYELYFISPDNERITVPFSKQTMREFVSSKITCNPVKMAPIYNAPNAIVYRLYVNDGHNNENSHL